MQAVCPRDEAKTLIYPVSLEAEANQAVVRFGEPDPAWEEDIPSELLVSALPSAYEPHGRTKEKLGRVFARELLFYLGSRYLQMRKMSPSFSLAIDSMRKHQSLTSCLLVLADGLQPALFRCLVPYLCQIVRCRYCEWTGQAQFFPRGTLYVNWLVGRMVLGGAPSPNRAMLARALQKLVLLNPAVMSW